MKPELKSKNLLNVTKSKAKMWEYDIPIEHHIRIEESPEKLFPLSIALLGDVAAEINRGHENSESFKALNKELLFSAEFFNSFDESKLIESLTAKLRLLASAAFYLCDMPGNASVLAKSLKYKELSSETAGLDALLLWLLQGDISTKWEEYAVSYADFVKELPPAISLFYANGRSSEVELQIIDLRQKVYSDGTPEQLLLGDILSAVIRKKIGNASIRMLPHYTGIQFEQWLTALQKPSFIREFWPAQHLLGEKGVFRGESAIVQMPTSAGKTKSIELILRSAFLEKRTNLAVIIAPFRALCHEIKDSLAETFRGESVGVDTLSDVLQNDFEQNLAELLGLPSHPQILVVTPEKLLYVLRHHSEITENLKLIIFDEGHQFDTGRRGIIYELLLTSLKKFIPGDSQKILISAVIPNADEIGKWLNGNDTVAQGSNLSPTSKSIGFASWKTERGRIQYVKDAEDTFFVPRVIESKSLQKQGKEQKARKFPEKESGQDVALFLGLKLCGKGGVAIFCGRKDTAVNICKRVVEISGRGYPMAGVLESSDDAELLAISNLCAKNFGENSIEAKSAQLGIFAHHNNIPHGIRIAVEHAMREGKIRFVVCTSTLAQGVNLPIRYLIVTSFYQGKELIKVRDFHNLIGRAGRAGKHVEGSILFAEPDVYDNKSVHKEKWQWENAKNLLNATNSEKCVSSLLEIFKPIHNDKKENQRQTEPLSFEEIVAAYIENKMSELATSISKKVKDRGFDFDTVFSQLFQKGKLLESIENFLLAHWDDIAVDPEKLSLELAQQTLAFHLADDKSKHQVEKLFQLLAKNIAEKVPESTRKRIFGKTLYGIHTAKKIEEWVSVHKDELLVIAKADDFFETIWSLFYEVIVENNEKGLFAKFDSPNVRKDLLLAWSSGDSFPELLKLLNSRKVRKIFGKKRRDFTVEDMVNICENTFAFDGMLVVGAVIEFLESFKEFDSSIKEQFQVFQKMLKYGLPTVSAITIYELGFADRVIAQEMASVLKNKECDKNTILANIKSDVFEHIDTLPLYYRSLYKIFKNKEL
jgi:superfamily II DNA/RNA helicase